MQPIVISCPKSLKLLNLFLGDTNNDQRIELEMIDSSEVPQPFGQLLVHVRDMTSTLATFHGEEIALDVLEQRTVDNEILRHVVLRGKRSGRPVEYGAIRIRLDTLPDLARDEVLRGEEPLGGILNASATQYRSCPGGFLRIRPHPQIIQALKLGRRGRPAWLFGRCNCLTDSEGDIFAEVVEILPPDHLDMKCQS